MEGSGGAKISLADFIQSSPPMAAFTVSVPVTVYSNNVYRISGVPDVRLWCSNEKCNGRMIHDIEVGTTGSLGTDDIVRFFIDCSCVHCKADRHFIACVGYLEDDRESMTLLKIGQWPRFGDPLPNAVRSWAGEDRDMFRQARVAEDQGMGVAAFAYYRRIVERHFSRILESVRKAARGLGVGPEDLATMERAAAETQFSKAVDMMKPVFPNALRLEGGHNPLLLLHSSLSDGIHALSDAECLEIAGSIRVLLTEFAEKLSAIAQERSEMDEAVKRLLKHQRERRSGA